MKDGWFVRLLIRLGIVADDDENARCCALDDEWERAGK